MKERRTLGFRTHFRLLLLFFFLSGFSSLVYEVAWGRTLTLVMGGSVYAVSVILTTFMGGLALGSWYLGRISDRIRRPLLFYGILELGIGAYGVLVPFVTPLLYRIYIPLAGDLGNHATVMLIRAFVCFLFLLLPTFLMGGTFPIVIRHLTRSLEKLGNTIGKLYSLNTFGGVAGALLAGIVLIKAFGLRNTVFIAAAVNMVVAGAAILLSRRPISDVEPEEPAGVPVQVAVETVPRTAVLLVVALSGFCSLSYEVLWTRMLTFILGNSTWAFSTILVAFLTGIALGSMIVSRFVDRMKNLPLLITVLEVAAAVCALLLIPAYGKFYIVRSWIVDSIGTVDGMLIAFFIVSFLAMIVPTTLLGMVFPAAGKIYARRLSTVGRRIGGLYALSTLGAIAGAMLPAFLMIPLLGLQNALIATVIVNAAAGAILIAAASAKPALKLTFAAVPVVLLLSGYALLPRDLELRGPLPGYERIFRHETSGGIIEILETRRQKTKTLILNGVPEVPTDRISMQTFRMLAFLPTLMHPDPREALVVTFGGGIVTGTLSRYDLDRIDCVEIFPGISAAAPYFRKENHAVLDNPRVNLIIEDGRNHLLTTDRRYDIITADATHPTGADSWVLYTTKYYEICRDHLYPEGIFAQWLPLHMLSFDAYCTILRTIRSVFPHVEIWFTGVNREYGHTIVLASQRDLRIDYQLFARRLEAPVIREDLEPYGLTDPPDVLGLRLTDERGIDRMVEGVPLNTDDRPVISFPTTLPGETDNLDNLTRVLPFRTPPRLTNLTAEASREIKSMLEALPFRLQGELFYYSGEAVKAHRELHRALSRYPADRRSHELLSRMEKKRAKDRTLADAALRREPDAEGLFAQGYLAYTRNEYQQAKDFFLASIERQASFPEPYCYLGLTLIELGEYSMAEEYLQKTLEISPEFGMAHWGLLRLEEAR